MVVDLKGRVRERPAVVGGASLALLGGASLLTFRAVARHREARRPVNRWRRLAHQLVDELDRLDRTQDALEVVRYRDGHGRAPARSKEKPGMIKKLLWMGLTAGTLALAGLLARRVSSMIWEIVMREPPPTAKV